MKPNYHKRNHKSQRNEICRESDEVLEVVGVKKRHTGWAELSWNGLEDIRANAWDEATLSMSINLVILVP